MPRARDEKYVILFSININFKNNKSNAYGTLPEAVDEIYMTRLVTYLQRDATQTHQGMDYKKNNISTDNENGRDIKSERKQRRTFPGKERSCVVSRRTTKRAP
jgi:hypothetical protein